jgi:steroid 5-alpha reductase family enzyme
MQDPIDSTVSDPVRPSTPYDRARVAEATRRVAALKGFYVHLAVFALVLAALFVINTATGDSWWVQWVLFGWGIGVVAHALAVFGRTPEAVASWEKRKIKELARER